MKNVKKTLAICTTVLALCLTSVTVYAASTYNSPSEAVAGLTGRTLDSVVSERVDTGKTYGTIANEAGVLDEFNVEMLEMKKDILQSKVSDGIMTQEEAEVIISAIEENQANCDGTNTAKIGQKMGAGFGNQKGTLNNSGMRQGKGQGMGQGSGNMGTGGFGSGNCINY